MSVRPVLIRFTLLIAVTLLLGGSMFLLLTAQSVSTVQPQVGTWSEEQIATLLRTGAIPDIPDDDRFNGGQVRGVIALIVQTAFSQMTQDDALAIAAYLKQIPAVSNVPMAPVQASIAVTKTVGTIPGVCADTDQISVGSGTRVYYCYTVQNTGGITLSLHDLVDDVSGPILSQFDFDLGPGQSVDTVAAGLTISYTPSVTTTNVATWTASTGPGTNTFQAVATDTATVNVGPAAEEAIVLTKTVGIQGYEPACPEDSEIKVPVNTTVKYCYQVANVGDVTLNLHTLVDDQLGELFSDLSANLTPGETVSTVDLGRVITAVIAVSTTNVATWTARVAPTIDVAALAQDGAIAVQNAVVEVSGPNDDSDNDGVPDNEEGAGDDDGDGIPNFLDPLAPTALDTTEQPDQPRSIFLPILIQ